MMECSTCFKLFTLTVLCCEDACICAELTINNTNVLSVVQEPLWFHCYSWAVDAEHLFLGHRKDRDLVNKTYCLLLDLKYCTVSLMLSFIAPGSEGSLTICTNRLKASSTPNPVDPEQGWTYQSRPVQSFLR